MQSAAGVERGAVAQGRAKSPTDCWRGLPLVGSMLVACAGEQGAIVLPRAFNERSKALFVDVDGLRLDLVSSGSVPLPRIQHPVAIRAEPAVAIAPTYRQVAPAWARAGSLDPACPQDGAIFFNSSTPYTRVGMAFGTGLWLTHQLRLEPSLGATMTTRDLPNIVPRWGLSARASLTRRFH